MAVTIKQVTDRKELRRFAKFPNDLYRGNKFFVPQIVSMDMDTFDPKKNRAFEVCEGEYWLALDETGKVVGRIAGIINHKYNEKVGQKICRFGWIDFIDSQEVASALLAKVEEYASNKGMDSGSLNLMSPVCLSTDSTRSLRPTGNTMTRTTNRGS